MSLEAKDQGLANKAVEAAGAGSGERKDQTVPEASSDEAAAAAAKLAEDAVADAEQLGKDAIADAEQVAKGGPSHLLTSAAQAAGDLVHEAVSDAKGLLHDAVDLGKAIVEDVEEKLGIGDPDAEHDAALRAQYDGTHDLAARGGDGAANR